MFKDKKVVVTGGSGFIGTHFINELLERGAQVKTYIHNTPKEKAEERAKELLGFLGLKNRANHKPGELSGGEQQRVAIARALSVNPPIILGDEPTGNLDTKTSISIIDLLYDFNQKTGKTIILITHDPEVAVRASRVITFKDGCIEDEDYDLKFKKII